MFVLRLRTDVSIDMQLIAKKSCSFHSTVHDNMIYYGNRIKLNIVQPPSTPSHLQKSSIQGFFLLHFSVLTSQDIQTLTETTRERYCFFYITILRNNYVCLNLSFFKTHFTFGTLNRHNQFQNLQINPCCENKDINISDNK